MSTISRRSILILFLLVTANSAVKAQFLGQQSLSESSYVIDSSGQLWEWGDNFYSQLGFNDRVNRGTPTVIPVPSGASKWVLVSGGSDFTLAVADSDKLYAWGNNDKGQIGTGTVSGIYALPTRITNPPTVTSWKWISAGAGHCEALTTDGRLFAWGDNAQGELGVGTTETVTTPQEVQFPTDVTAWEDVAAGPGYTLMVSQSGVLYACGKDSLGAFTPSEGPLRALLDTVRAFSPLPCVAASDSIESKIVSEPIGVDGGFTDKNGSSPPTTAAVAAGGAHTLYLMMTGSIGTEGDNTYGQLGLGSYENIPVGTVKFPTGVTQFVAVAAGLRHSLAIGNDGWLYAWGDNSVGELGVDSGSNQTSPVKVLKVGPSLAMSASFSGSAEFSSPFTVGLTVKNTSAGSLTDADAFMLIGPPMYLTNAPDQGLSSPITSNASSSASWSGNVNPPLWATANESYFAYVRASGSAPLLVVGYDSIPPIPWKTCDEAITEDSLTFAPVPYAQLIFPGAPNEGCAGLVFSGSELDSNKIVANANGIIPSLCFHGPVFTNKPSFLGNAVTSFPFIVQCENFQSIYYAPTEPAQGGIKQDSIFYLLPSAIQGMFALPAQSLIDSFQKVYYPDSLIGYAISRRVIFRTLDSGMAWSAMFTADTNLHDIKFRDIAHGWAVGDGGEILNTTDSGNTWAVTHVGSQNLRALFVIDFDTAWAIGDNGTVLRKSGNSWAAEPVLAPDSLTCIHFLDAEDGVIGGNGVYYVYDSGAWVRDSVSYYPGVGAPNSVSTNLRSVSYAAPGLMYFAGSNTNGSILVYNSYLGTLCGGTGDTIAGDSIFTRHTVNSLYFLNPYIGYAAGDSGSSFVSYDSGHSWADLIELPQTATSVNFFGLHGHAVSDSGILNYDGMPSPTSSIVCGRITYGNPPEPILGAQVERIYISDSSTSVLDITYTNEQGYFVILGIDSIFPYQYQINFTDSSIAKTKTFDSVQMQNRHEILTLNYNDYSGPLSVSSIPESTLSLNVNVVQSIAQIEYSIPAEGPAQITMQDILGRTVRTISDGFNPAGLQETDVSLDGLPTGAYFVTLVSSEGSLTKKLVVLQ